MFLTYCYRLLPSKRQHAALERIREDQRVLYNAALEERIGAYRLAGVARSYQDQTRALTACRADIPQMAVLPVNLQRWTLKRLDDAFAAFRKRAKARNGKAGFPRFRGRSRWASFGFQEFSGIGFDGKRLRFKGLPGGVPLHLHRPLPQNADIRSCTFTRDAKGWYVGLQIAVEEATKRVVKSAIGVDLGISTLAFLSDGTSIPTPRAGRRAERKMRIAQRALARCRRQSKRRRKVRATLTRLHGQIAAARDTALHQASAALVHGYDAIVVEALNVKGLARGMLARDVHDAGWAKFIGMVRYKAAKAGAHLLEVDPRFTSQDCSGCGARVAKPLSQRVHRCGSCGLALDRDYNAARNILFRAAGAVVRPEALNVGQWPERVPGNVA
jgi:putative transposase